jgi:hypothetical protein
MACEIGDKLRLRFEATTREWKKYEERLGGSFQTYANLKERRRLRSENTVARTDFLEHKKHCSVCGNRR